MKKIKYNIATGKKIQLGRFLFLIGAVWILAIMFFAIGLNQISSKSKQGRTEAKELNILKRKLSDVSEMTGDYHKKIDHLKRGWGKKIGFSNSLINRKSFSYITVLNQLEERLLPDMFVSSMRISSDSQSSIHVEVVATTFKKMGEFYDKFPPKNLNINKESLEPNGLVRASLSIGLADEKK